MSRKLHVGVHHQQDLFANLHGKAILIMKFKDGMASHFVYCIKVSVCLSYVYRTVHSAHVAFRWLGCGPLTVGRVHYMVLFRFTVKSWSNVGTRLYREEMVASCEILEINWLCMYIFLKFSLKVQLYFKGRVLNLLSQWCKVQISLCFISVAFVIQQLQYGEYRAEAPPVYTAAAV